MHNILQVHIWAGVLLLSVLFCSVSSFASTYTVTNISGASAVKNSLPWAVSQANASQDQSQIKFQIPSSEVKHPIVLEERMWVTSPMKIDGTTQVGYTEFPLIKIDVNGKQNAFTILHDPKKNKSGKNTEIKGLQIYNFTRNAIATQPGANNIVIIDNYIGFYFDESLGMWWRNFEANLSMEQINNKEEPVYGDYVQAVGIGLQSSQNTVSNNVISGVHNGIAIGYDFESKGPDEWGPICRDNTISHNLIGTTPDGLGVLTNTPGADTYRPDPEAHPLGSPHVWKYFGNNSDGIYLAARAQNTVIADNVVSGNYSAGIEVLHHTASHNQIFSNIVGLDSKERKCLSNGELGIILSNGAHDNLVGGDSGQNIVAGNSYAGIQLGGEGSFKKANFNTIAGNMIGCYRDGRLVINNNQQTGIHLGTRFSRHNTIIGNTIGGNEWGIYLEGAQSNAVIGNFVGTTKSGMQIGNDKTGIVLDRSDNNNVVDNIVSYNGFGIEEHSDWFYGIWEIDSNNNFYANKISKNRKETNTKNSVLPGGVFIDPSFSLYMPLIKFQNLHLRMYLQLCIEDEVNPRWKLSESMLDIVQPPKDFSAPLTIADDLSIAISGASLQGQYISLIMQIDTEISGGEGIFWKIATINASPKSLYLQE